MKKIYLLNALFISVCFNIWAQPNFIWGKKVGGIGSDRSFAVAADQTGNLYTVGTFTNTVDFDPNATVFNLTCTTGSSETFIHKLDPNGNLIWVKQLIGLTVNAGIRANGITVDQGGNVLMTGMFSFSFDFDPGPGTYTMTANSAPSGWAIFVLKLDASGNFVWAKQFGGSTSSSNIAGQAIVCDVSGNVFSCGSIDVAPIDFDPGPGTYTLVSAGSRDAYVSKLDPNGNFLWANVFGGLNAEYGLDIAMDGSNNVYTTGFFSGTADFDPSASVLTLTTVAAGDNDAFVQKMDQSGNFIWAKSWGSGNDQIGRGIACKNGFIYTVGDFYNTVDFDPSAASFTLAASGLRDVFLNVLDVNGNFSFVKQFGGTSDDIGNDVCVDGANNIALAGQFGGTGDFDPGPGSYSLTSSGLSNGFVTLLDQSGAFIYAGSFNGAGTNVVQSITSTGSGHLFLTGFYTGAATDLDPSSGVFNVSSAGNNDVFFVKLGACSSVPSAPGSIQGVNSICSSASNYSIATVVGANSYSWTLPGGWSGTSTTNIISGTPGGSGIMSVTAINACGSSSAQTLSITVNPNPTISVNSGAICNGGSFTINPSGANTYTIQGGNAVVSPTSTTSYTVVGTSSAGCVSNTFATSNITVNPLPTVSANTSTNQLCVGSSATLTGSGASTYTWNPGGSGSSIVISPTVNTTYTVTGTDVNGCQNTSVITQSVINCSGGVGIVANSVNSGFFNVYPNPVKEKLIIQADRKLESIEVYNSIGEIILTISNNSSSIEIDLSVRSKGIYFVRIGSYTTKIIKE